MKTQLSRGGQLKSVGRGFNRTQRLFLAALVASAALIVVAVIHGVESIERATIERVRAERETAAEQAAGRLSALLDQIRARIASPLLRKAAGVDPARDRKALGFALAELADDLPRENIVLFVHDAQGSVVAVDARQPPETAAMVAEHHHPLPSNTASAHVHICPVCARDEHAVSLVEPLGAGFFLSANVRLDKVGAALLGQMTVSRDHGICIESHSGIPIVCRGSTLEPSEKTIAPLREQSLRIRTFTSSPAIGREQRAAVSGLLAASLAALGLLAVTAWLVIRAGARQRQEEVALTSRLAEVDKLASIGTFAAEAVHELSNPLSAVKANIDFWQPNDADSQSARDDVRLALDRVRETLDDLRRFSRRAPATTADFDLRTCVATALRLALPKTKYSCRVEAHLDAPLWVHGNATHVSQIVLNLVTNASQALKGLKPADAHIDISAALGDGRVAIAVEDNGPGVLAANIPNLFRSFFTTKGPDEGTGLGLAVSARLARESGGELRYAPNGRGARFVLEFPRATTKDGGTG